jgi:GDP-mannose 4,6-dehydratase
VNVIDLGVQSLASVFPTSINEAIPATPLVLCKCDECDLVQLRWSLPPASLYETMQYGYRSGVNRTMTQHLHDLVADTIHSLRRTPLTENSVVVDIGCNDGTLLKQYPSYVRRVGVDPSARQFLDFYKDTTIELVTTYFSATSSQSIGSSCANIITSISMFYDLPQPQAFMHHVHALLHPQGLWVMEQSYLPAMLSNHSFDTICHEHLEYYALRQIHYMARRASLRITRIAFNTCNGGSFRVTLCRDTASYPTAKNLETVLDSEAYLSDVVTYKTFMQECEQRKHELVTLLKHLRAAGKRIYMYGASTKGNTLLQYYGIDHSFIRAAAERNPSKYGRFTPHTQIPILSEEEVRAASPQYMLVLPWHFREEFLEREDAFLTSGGQFIFPLPSVSIVSSRPIALVTGVSGQIGHHLAPLLVDKGYHVYGTSRNDDYRSPYCTGLSHANLSAWLRVLAPQHVYHLAAQTENDASTLDPAATMDTNATLAIEVMHSAPRHSRICIASTTDICKGAVAGIYTEDTLPIVPTTPYGIAKAAAFWHARHARAKGQFVCAAILGNIESARRRSCYVSQIIATWARKPLTEPLELRHIEGVDRDWLHVSDAVQGLWLMMTQDTPDEYLVTSGRTSSLRTFINAALDISGTEWQWQSATVCVEPDSQQVLVTCGESVAKETRKVFCNDRLSALGWAPEISLRELVYEMMRGQVPLRVPVSTGEALDKLTILELKSTLIRDKEKLVFVHQELEALGAIVGGFLKSVPVREKFDDLKTVNKLLWDQVEQDRQQNTRSAVLNDMRFRLKRDLDTLTQSAFKEQKLLT